MLINGEPFSTRELDYIQMLDNGEKDSVVRNTMGNKYPLNPISVIERFVSALTTAFNNASKSKE